MYVSLFLFVRACILAHMWVSFCAHSMGANETEKIAHVRVFFLVAVPALQQCVRERVGGSLAEYIYTHVLIYIYIYV